jgi:hypothetical protein
MSAMVKVVKCDVRKCAFNYDGQCHTMAITIGSSEPDCDAFFEATSKAGIEDVIAGVGSCKITNCKHNKNLECGATQGIAVGFSAGHALCRTFRTT